MKVPLKYIELIKDIYDKAITSVKTSREITSEFPITIDLHQKSALIKPTWSSLELWYIGNLFGWRTNLLTWSSLESLYIGNLLWWPTHP